MTNTLDVDISWRFAACKRTPNTFRKPQTKAKLSLSLKCVHSTRSKVLYDRMTRKQPQTMATSLIICQPMRRAYSHCVRISFMLYAFSRRSTPTKFKSYILTFYVGHHTRKARGPVSPQPMLYRSSAIFAWIFSIQASPVGNGLIVAVEVVDIVDIVCDVEKVFHSSRCPDKQRLANDMYSDAEWMEANIFEMVKPRKT